jgi:hypothetical protein
LGLGNWEIAFVRGVLNHPEIQDMPGISELSDFTISQFPNPKISQFPTVSLPPDEKNAE